MTPIRTTTLVTGATIALGSSFLIYNRQRIRKTLWQWKLNSLVDRELNRIVIVENEEQWKTVEAEMINCCQSLGAIGFDCEWVTIKKTRRPVSLLQLATHTNLCVLIRLCKMETLPQSLEMILKDPSVVKVGVAPEEDCKLLFNDYGHVVNGSLDLVKLFKYYQVTSKSAIMEKVKQKKKKKDRNGEKKESETTSKEEDISEEMAKLPPPPNGLKLEFKDIPNSFGLKALSEHYLGRSMDKDWRIRSSDWESENLSRRQINYAAEDARCGLHILLKILLVTNYFDSYVMRESPSYLSVLSWASFTRQMLFSAVTPVLASAPTDLWNAKFMTKSNNQSQPKNVHPQANSKGYRRAYSLRKSPLYHNSVLWAPDDEPLCTVDPKKAYWYVENGLGEVVQEEPLIVRLTFEPTGRPQKEGSDGYFYLNERQNNCVVCGKDESYIRKNVVPHEYRKHFPEILKSHQNHDVVLLCTNCHQLSNQRDAILRYKLAEIHDAPIGNTTDVKVVVNGNLKVIKSAGTALIRSKKVMPQARIEELEKILRDFFETEELTHELLLKASTLDVSIVNSSYEPHGLRVYKHYEKIGVILMEKLWRENFLETMKPEFLPQGWSVSHNHEKLKLKMARYPLDDPVRLWYKIALVGTDGQIDVPYDQQNDVQRKRQEETGRHVKNDWSELMKSRDDIEEEEADESPLSETDETIITETGETPIAETGETTVTETGEKPLPETGEKPLAETGETTVTETGEKGLPETGEKPLAETGEKPLPETGEKPLPGTGEKPLAETDEKPRAET